MSMVLIMKDIKKILYTLVLALCAISCTKDKSWYDGGWFEKTPSYFYVYGSYLHSLSFGASDNLTQWIRMEVQENTDWTITGAPDWLSFSQVNGDVYYGITVTASENKSADKARAAVFYVGTTSLRHNITCPLEATQEAATPYINVDRTSLSFEATEKTAKVNVNSNVAWEAYSILSWISVSKTDDKTLQISVTENTGSTRTGTVALRRTGTTALLATINVTQGEGGVTGSTATVSFGVDGGTEAVEMTADVSWNAYTSSESWLSVTPAKGAGGKAQLGITALANGSTAARDGYVYVRIGTIRKLAIPVSQEGILLAVDGSPNNFAANDDVEQKLTVRSNKEWTVISQPEWLTVTPGEGKVGTTDISLSVAVNNSLNPRSATLRIGIEGLNLYKDITVVQAGLVTDLGDYSLEFGWEEAERELGITVPGSWSAIASDDWFTLSQYEGNGGETIVVTASTNDGEEGRMGTIAIVTEGNTISVPVIQQGQYLKISSTAGEVGAMGGSINLSVKTSVGSETSVEYDSVAGDWLSYGGGDDGVYTLTAVYNPSIKSRTAQFVVKPSRDVTSEACIQGVKFEVRQKGRSLATNVSEIFMLSKNATSGTYSIVADGEYGITRPDSDGWYTVQHMPYDDTFSITVLDNDTGNDRSSHIVISLVDLPDGEEKSLLIPVRQFGKDVEVNVDGWGEDKNWD